MRSCRGSLVRHEKKSSDLLIIRNIQFSQLPSPMRASKMCPHTEEK